jgi:long-chain acyl-CoA synthetase
VVVFGDRRPYCVALVTLVPGVGPEAAGEAIERANASLAPYETVKKFKVLAGDFAIENELLTPTLKVKRRAVEASFSSDIEALYAERA